MLIWMEYQINWMNNHSTDIKLMVEIGANQGIFTYLVAKKAGIDKIITIIIPSMYTRLVF